LSRVAEHVSVTRFRYIEELKTSDKKLTAGQSEIADICPAGIGRSWVRFCNLVAGGSVSGAPKAKTIQIIQEAEQEKTRLLCKCFLATLTGPVGKRSDESIY